LDTGLNAKEIEVITVSDEFAEVVPKTEEVAAVVPKIEDSVEMVAELMSQGSGVRVRYYMDLEQVRDAVLQWREGVSGGDSGESEIEEIEEVPGDVDDIEEESDKGGDVA
jgi:hypothetical protein